MNELNLEIEDADTSGHSDLYTDLSTLLGENNVQQVATKGDIGAVHYLLSVGGGVVLTKLSNIIVSWINRNSKKTVKLGQTILNGYTADEVAIILEANKKDK